MIAIRVQATAVYRVHDTRCSVGAIVPYTTALVWGTAIKLWTWLGSTGSLVPLPAAAYARGIMVPTIWLVSDEPIPSDKTPPKTQHITPDSPLTDSFARNSN